MNRNTSFGAGANDHEDDELHPNTRGLPATVQAVSKAGTNLRIAVEAARHHVARRLGLPPTAITGAEPGNDTDIWAMGEQASKPFTHHVFFGYPGEGEPFSSGTKVDPTTSWGTSGRFAISKTSPEAFNCVGEVSER